ncbi:MAG TPA: hypothetical protein VGX96_16795, partial [Candidatus Elarobacter sp.]|nr:hypothetical protein [Candidatus Elarobacter sp.]
MRRFLVVALVAFFGLPLVAGAQTSLFAKPSVIVYPFSASASSIDREASSRLATIIATRMAETRQVTVIPPPPGTERKDYLSAARAHNADYYVAGFISPLGNGVSMVEQVVSTTTGIVLYSQTAQLNTYDEASGQGDDLAYFIAHHANRGLAAIGTAPPQTSPTPSATGGPQANVGKLFSRRKKATPTPKPTATAASANIVPTPPARGAVPAPPTAAPRVAPAPPTATPRAATAAPRAATVSAVTPTPRPAAVSAVTPTSAPLPPPSAAPTAAPRTVAATTANAETIAVVPTEGSADAQLREIATQRLLAKTNGERVASAAAACGAHPVRAILSSTLSTRPDPQFGGASATFEMSAHDCAGKLLWKQTHSNDAGGTAGAQLATE